MDVSARSRLTIACEMRLGAVSSIKLVGLPSCSLDSLTWDASVAYVEGMNCRCPSTPSQPGLAPCFASLVKCVPFAIACRGATCCASGGLGLAGLGLADLLRLAEDAAATTDDAATLVRPGQVDHPDSPVRLAEPDRVRRSQARRARWRFAASLGSIPSSLPGCDVCELLPNLRQGDGSHHGAALDDASLSAARRGVRADRRADDRCADGAEPARSAALAVFRLGRRLRRSAARAGRGRSGRAAQVPANIALPFKLQQPPRRRSAARRAVRHVPGRRIRPGVDRLCRPRRPRV